MNDLEAKQCYESMLKFIHSHGDDQIQQINKQANEDFKREMASYIRSEKERIDKEFETRLA